MTVFKRGSVFLKCLICGHRDFEIIKNNRTRGKALKCKRCGFMFKDDGFFDSMPKGTSVIAKGRSPIKARKEKFSGYLKKVTQLIEIK